MFALTFETFGGPEVLRYREVPDPVARPGEVLVDVRAAGVNFADIYRRRGHYRELGEPPYIDGYEGAGVVVALGAGVGGLHIGDRIGFVDVARANVTRLAVPAERAIPLPEGVDEVTAAAILLQGLTAQYLSEDSAAIRPGDSVLVHSAAGGVGRHLLRLCRAKGARVIAMASSEEKRRIARDLGAEAVLGYDGDWVAGVRALTGGGADVVYDAVGSTLARSIEAARNRGTIVTYGMSGGAPAPVDPLMLMQSSKALRGAELWDYLDSGAERRRRSRKLFDALAAGVIAVPPIETFTLADGAAAHRRLEDRGFSGKVVLVP
ncbi:quinone oxidoreductase family protein [Paenirhodobacter enshiensis]|uniref:quinone oxidoreductase family protein n=1 Tax=Paenirhodobacter enshiensis TaxID=1105367 RepID=UPI003FA2B7E9